MCRSPPLFPNTTLGNQLKQVAKVVKFNSTSPALGLNRQIFFCQLGGFDTHQDQAATQSSLLVQVSQAIKAFYDATLELGLEQQITTFTLSDFGRTFQPAGSGAAAGSDHAWGNHHIVLGGAVRGGDFYGGYGPERHGVPRPGAERTERHGQSRTLDPDDLGGTVCGDAGLLVWRVAGRHSDRVPEYQSVRHLQPGIHGLTCARRLDLFPRFSEQNFFDPPPGVVLRVFEWDGAFW